ncbi:MAG: hypothetical protein IPN42_07710 [Methylococcaceae bacterium]|nr:hypothetical protein [Methylococcaceae bacterium]
MRLVYSSGELSYALVEISVQEWLDTKDSEFFNFFHNDEENTWLFLENTPCLSPLLSMLALAKVDGELYKLNGKPRLIAWTSDKLRAPDVLIAQIIDIKAANFFALENEIKAKRKASLPANEWVKEMYKELGLSFNSNRLKEGLISEAITIAFRGRPRELQDKRFIKERVELNLKKAIGLFSEELLFIDSLNPKPEIFMTGVLAAALIMLGGTSQPTEIREFLLRLNNKQGEIKEGLEDPVAGLLRVLEGYRMSDRNAQSHMTIGLCKIALQSMTLWQEGADSPKFWRKKLVTGIDHMPYIRKLKHQKDVYADMDM